MGSEVMIRGPVLGKILLPFFPHLPHQPLGQLFPNLFAVGFGVVEGGMPGGLTGGIQLLVEKEKGEGAVVKRKGLGTLLAVHELPVGGEGADPGGDFPRLRGKVAGVAPVENPVGRHGSRQAVPLPVTGTEGGRHLDHSRILEPLHHHSVAEFPAHLDDRSQDAEGFEGEGPDMGQQGLVDLDLVEGQAREPLEAAVAGPQIVHRKAHTGGDQPGDGVVLSRKIEAPLLKEFEREA